jgi:hypothetical protein
MSYQPISSNQNSAQENTIILAMDHGTYCTDLNCPCHTDVDYHAQITAIPQYSDDEISSAFRYFGIRQ